MIVILGRKNDLYTKMIVSFFEQASLDKFIILENSENSKNRTIGKARALLSAGRFKGVSKWHFYYYFLIVEAIIAKFDKRQSLIRQRFANVVLQGDLTVSNINDPIVISTLNEIRPSIGVLGGVGIVNKEVLHCFSQFCLNSHPGHLPDCRGGGAIELTLCKGLPPCATIHIVEEGIDTGAILTIKPLQVNDRDSIPFVSLRLMILGAQTLVEVCQQLLNGKVVEPRSHDGVLNTWAGLNAQKQRRARRALFKLMKENYSKWSG